MSRSCIVVGCGQPTAGYSHLCTRHRKATTRHGHPLQAPVRVSDLKPYLRTLRGCRSRNPDSPLWEGLRQRWRLLVGAAAERLQSFHRGVPDNRYVVSAARELQKLAGAVAEDTVIDTLLAMFFLYVAQPHRFKSDRAFDHQLVRRVRALADLNVGRYWSQRSRRVKLVYRDLPPKTAGVLAQLLRETFGVVGIRLAEHELGREERERQERLRLAEAVEALT